jgi:hypothetical protein
LVHAAFCGAAIGDGLDLRRLPHFPAVFLLVGVPTLLFFT